jgi:hypothetical protein
LWLIHLRITVSVLQHNYISLPLQKYLKGKDYPAKKESLLEPAKEQGADRDICSTLEQLPDEEYETPADVSKAVGAIE